MPSPNEVQIRENHKFLGQDSCSHRADSSRNLLDILHLAMWVWTDNLGVIPNTEVGNFVTKYVSLGLTQTYSNL
jgi:hypothetical protein